jgi:tight adherence protein C
VIAIALIGGLLIGIFVLFAIRAIALPGGTAATRLEQIESYGYQGTMAQPAPAHAPQEAAFGGVARSLGRAMMERAPSIQEADVRRELRQAGIYNVAVPVFIGYRVGAAILAAGTVVLFGLSGAFGPGLTILLAPVAAVLGFRLPRQIVKRKMEQRYEEIEYQLPELVDILVVTIESGLALSRSLQVASQRVTGVLGQELRLTLQEQQMGLATPDALAGLLERCDTVSMRSFVRSVTQGESLGVSIGEIMRNLAREMRVRRRQAAETRAQKAPVKILFPLIAFIFPALFLVLLYPAVHSLLNGLGGG